MGRVHFVLTKDEDEERLVIYFAISICTSPFIRSYCVVCLFYSLFWIHLKAPKITLPNQIVHCLRRLLWFLINFTIQERFHLTMNVSKAMNFFFSFQTMKRAMENMIGRFIQSGYYHSLSAFSVFFSFVASWYWCKEHFSLVPCNIYHSINAHRRWNKNFEIICSIEHSKTKNLFP